MNEFVFVEFLVDTKDLSILENKLAKLVDTGDFVNAHPAGLIEIFPDRTCRIISGKIASAVASLIKLQDPFLAECMRVSYISEDLKNKYRR